MRAGRHRALVDVHLAVCAREACGAATLVVVDEVDALLAGGASHPGAVVNVLLAVGARVAQQAGAAVVRALAPLQSSAVRATQSVCSGHLVPDPGAGSPRQAGRPRARVVLRLAGHPHVPRPAQTRK